ncbi:sodium:solute symporter family protein [Persicobacter diffluens]|uniref:Sodium transporter n=1 Tax=Persicobacter diffluens TaxID=981 RepID=A0AAN4W1H4_9BACT|nr:hypothetical protein PEDI_45860 [Persicobacter diffluens]
MNTFDYLVIGLFSLIVLAVGLLFAREKDMKSFFAGGGSVPWAMSGLSLFMGFFSAGTFVVWGAIAYEYGAVAIGIQWTMCVAGFLVGKFIAGKWHQTGALTAAEYLRYRFGDSTQKLFTYIFLFMSLAYTGAFLYPVAKIISVSMDVSVYRCIVVLGLFMILYTTLGGLKAVMVTDVLQFIILTCAILVVLPLSFEEIGGVQALFGKAPEGFFAITNEKYNPLFLFSFGIYNAIFLGGNWAYIQRYTSVGNRKAAKKVVYLFGCLYTFSPVLWMLPPMLYKLIDPNLSGLDMEGAYLLICQKVLPAGMLGLMIGGMLYATASSVNGALNISAAVITNDIVLRILPQLKGKQLIQVARLATILCGCCAIGVALLVPLAGGIVNVILSISAVTGVSLYGPPIWSLFSKRLSGKGFISITSVSLLINISLKFAPAFMNWGGLNRAEEMLFGVLIPLVLLTTSEIYYSLVKSIAETRVPEIAIRRAEVEEAGQTNAFSLRVMSYSLTAVGVLLASIALLASAGTMYLLVLSVLIFGLSYFVWTKSKIEAKQKTKALETA